METAFTLDKESNTLALICHELEVALAFDSRETLIQWQVHIRNHLPEVQQFLVQVTHTPPKSRLSCGPARLHLQNKRFSLVTGIPPKLAGHWQIPHLRKFGIVDGRFCFEGGSQCGKGKGEGLHVLHTNQCDELAKAFDLSASGKLCSKRKPLRKLQHSDSCTCWMSSQGFCSHRSGSDSGRRLPSSGSDGSTSEISSEILRFSSARNEINDSEDTTSTRSTCFTSLRWSSSTNESVVGYVSSHSLNGDSHRSSHLPSCLRQQPFIPPCDNPYLQNYAVPRNSSLSECKSTCSSINTLCSRGMLQSEEAGESRFTPEILSFHMAKDLDLSSDETNSGSSSDSTFGSNLRSSCSTCSSNGSGPSVFVSSPLTSSTSASVCCNCCNVSSASAFHQHYQAPRAVLACEYLKETGVADGRKSQRQSPCRQPIMSNTGEFYDVPKNLKAGSLGSIT